MLVLKSIELHDRARKASGNAKKAFSKLQSRGESLISYHSRKSYHPIFSQTVKAEDAVNALKHAARRENELQKRK